MVVVVVQQVLQECLIMVNDGHENVVMSRAGSTDLGFTR